MLLFQLTKHITIFCLYARDNMELIVFGTRFVLCNSFLYHNPTFKLQRMFGILNFWNFFSINDTHQYNYSIINRNSAYVVKKRQIKKRYKLFRCLTIWWSISHYHSYVNCTGRNPLLTVIAQRCWWLPKFARLFLWYFVNILDKNNTKLDKYKFKTNVQKLFGEFRGCS